ncbi:MauE/DoxX family redox-associated membrane protein [Tumebacillus avium]|nr:MauE/DoxX family redox-associated membrane protein [Tumebacillus avium]
MDQLALLLRLLLAFLFFTTAWSKLKKMGEHIGIVEDYKILPKRLVKPFAKGEVYFELSLSLLLIVGIYQDLTALAAVLLLLIYTTAITVNLLRGRKEISCGCGGAAGNHQLSGWLVLRNAVLIVLAMIVYAVNTPLLSADALLSGYSIAAVLGLEMWVLLLAAVAAMFVWTIVNEMQAISNEMRSFWERG